MEPLTHIVRHVLSEFPVQSLFVNNLQSSLQCVVPKLQHAVVTIITTMCRGSAGGGSYFSTAGRGWQVGRGQVSRLIHTYLLQLLCSAGPVQLWESRHIRVATSSTISTLSSSICGWVGNTPLYSCPVEPIPPTPGGGLPCKPWLLEVIQGFMDN